MTLKKEQIDVDSDEYQDDPQDLCDWEHISNSEAKDCYSEDLSPPPDLLSDPFKERFTNIKESYRKVS